MSAYYCASCRTWVDACSHSIEERRNPYSAYVRTSDENNMRREIRELEAKVAALQAEIERLKAEKKDDEMLQITIVNDGTGKNGRGNYDYTVTVNDVVIAEGHHRGHLRERAWYHLIGTICDNLRVEEKRQQDIDMASSLIHFRDKT